MAASLRMLRTAIIVPCRLESKRFPRKLLHRINGKPLLCWVAERIRLVAPNLDLWFAVDDAALRDCLTPGGFRTVMTRVDHATGTDRIAEANRTVGADQVINVQADEPMVSARQIRLLADLIGGRADMATLAVRFETAEDFRNPNQVKVVCDGNGRARYFSRAPIPYPRDRGGELDDAWVAENPCYRHLGVYAYKSRLLEDFARLPGRGFPQTQPGQGGLRWKRPGEVVFAAPHPVAARPRGRARRRLGRGEPLLPAPRGLRLQIPASGGLCEAPLGQAGGDRAP